MVLTKPLREALPPDIYERAVACEAALEKLRKATLPGRPPIDYEDLRTVVLYIGALEGIAIGSAAMLAPKEKEKT